MKIKPKKLHRPPPKYWRFAVLFGAHMGLLLSVGPAKILGVYLVRFKEEFNANSGLIGSITTLTYFFLAVAGLGASMLCKRYSCRIVTMVGGFVICLGLVLTSYARSVFQLFLFIDVFAGIGIGLAGNPCLVVIAHYFDETYATANGLAMAGVDLGIVLLPPFSDYLSELYGWRGSLLIIGAIAMNVSAMGALFRPNPRIKEGFPDEDLSIEDWNESNQEEAAMLDRTNTDLENVEVNDFIKPTKTVQLPNDQANILNADESSQKTILDPTQETNVPTDSGDPSPAKEVVIAAASGDPSPAKEVVIAAASEDPSPAKEVIIAAASEDPSPDAIVAADSRNINEDQPTNSEDNVSQVKVSTIRTVINSMDLPVFLIPKYLVLMPVTMIVSSANTGILAHIVARGISAGIPTFSASFLLSGIGLTSMVTRATHGVIIDKGWLSSVRLYTLALVLGGIFTFLSLLCNSFVSFLIYTLFYGTTSGIFQCASVPIVKGVVPTRMLGGAVAWLFIFRGLGAFLGGLIAGSLYDATGNYDCSFIVIAGSFFLSAILMVAFSYAKGRKKRRDSIMLSPIELHVRECVGTGI